MPTREQRGQFEWLGDASYATAGCIAIVAGLTPAAAATAIGAEPRLTALRHETAVSDGVPIVSFIPGLDPAGTSFTWAIENNGLETSRPEVICRLSEKARAASVVWDVNDVVRFVAAEQGALVANFELGTSFSVAPKRFRGQLRELLSKNAAINQTAMTLLSTFMGIYPEPTPEVLAPSTGQKIIEPVLDLRISGEDLIALEYPSPELVAACARSRDAPRWNVAQWAAHRALQEAGLDNNPNIFAFLAQPDQPKSMTTMINLLRTTALHDLLAAEDRLNSPSATSAERQSAHELARRHWCCEALAYLAQPDATTALLGACYYAQLVVDGIAAESPSLAPMALHRLQLLS